MAWKWKRLQISAFLVFHMVAVIAWVVPACPLQARVIDVVAYYIFTTGQWQHWGMFAPDPIRDTCALEAIAVDSNGLWHTFRFPRETDRAWWNASLHYRYSKYASNFAVKEEFKAHREFAARHALRQLGLPADAFPVQVNLVYRVKPTPPPGTRPDPMVPTTTSVIESYRFPSLEEVLP
jgi:hypothetical protein